MTVNWHGLTISCEIGITSLPSVAIGSTSWTDVSAYLRNIPNIHRGRNSETDSFETGTMTVTLDNRDRRFDPNYAAGPYFGNLLPMRRIRLRFTSNAVTYAVWHGFVRGWPQEYHTSNKDAWVTLACDDGFAVLNRQRLPDSVYAVQLPADTPRGWWRLGESSGTQAIDSSGNSFDGVYLGGATFDSTAGLIYGTSNPAIAFDGVDDYALLPDGVITAYPFTVEAWVQLSGTQVAYLYAQTSFDGGERIVVSASATEAVVGLFQGNGTGVYNTNAAFTLNDSHPHHIVTVITDGNSNATIYIDGVARATTQSTLGTPVPFPAVNPGQGSIGAFMGALYPTLNYGSGTIDEVAVYTSALSAGTVAAHYGYGSTPWNGDTTGARIGRVLDIVGWPSADRTVATGITTMQSQVLASMTALSVLKACEQSEFSQLFMGADGTVTFRDRHWRFENASAITSQATFGDDGSGSELPYIVITSDDGQQLIYNRVRFTRDGGSVIDLSDSTSIGKFYERGSEQTGFQNQLDTEVRDFASWYLATHKNPIQRIAVLTVYPRRDPTNLIPAVLNLDIGERITVKRRPQNVGATLSFPLLVEGIDHSLNGRGEWSVDFYLSAADSQTALQPLILDDATYGILDTNVLAY